MSIAPDYSLQLIYGHITSDLSPEQELQLKEWINASDENKAYFKELTDLENIEREMILYGKGQQEADAVWEILRQRIPQLPVSFRAPVRRMNKRFIRYIPWAAVAVLVPVILLVIFQSREKQETVGPGPHSPILPANQPAFTTYPTTAFSKVYLTVDNDSIINLDNMGNGLVYMQGQVQIRKEDNRITYKTPHLPDPGSLLLHNILQTAVGMAYEVTLSDGTAVWLSTGSKLSYPVNFPAHERRIDLTGEAYFEVTKKKGQPFFVQARETVSEVKGTHFVIRAYAGDDQITTTVIKGEVLVKSASDSIRLVAGQQARLMTSNNWKRVNLSNPEDAASWKKGLLKFAKASPRDVLASVEQWYGYQAEGTNLIQPARQLTGTLNLKDSITNIATTLERNFQVHITVDAINRKLRIQR